MEPILPRATVTFDAKPPRHLCQEEHFIGFLTVENRAYSEDGKPPKGLEGYLLELADNCKGFRVVVLCSALAGIFKRYVKGFIFDERARSRPRIGTWRGYPVYLDEMLDEREPDEPLRGRLAATSTGPTIGALLVLNWEGFE